MKNEMTMTYEYISPAYAKALLESNVINRHLSKGTIKAYANDMESGNWTEQTGDSISIDTNGKLRNGQHRLLAIVESGTGIYTWVCRNVAPDGVYDSNRKRSISDQITIAKPEYEPIYKSTLYTSVVRNLIVHKDSSARRTVTHKEIINFTEEHKVSKINISAVHVGLLLAYLNGVDIEQIQKFYNILSTGMSSESKEFPIIAYRNYLMDGKTVRDIDREVARCQYALYKYLTGSCTKKNTDTKGLIYPYVWVDTNK